MAANMSGCSHQYAGNSVRETGERMTVHQQALSELEETGGDSHGGAVIELRSPVICAKLLMNDAQPAFCSCGTSAPVMSASRGGGRQTRRGRRGGTTQTVAGMIFSHG